VRGSRFDRSKLVQQWNFFYYLCRVPDRRLSIYWQAFPQRVHGEIVMQKPNQDYRKIASDCAKAASEAKSEGDREQLLEMNKRYLQLAENEGISEPRDSGTKSRRPSLFK
jgi:predicted DsbA family dithiol-disulfide isomerase